MLFKKKSPVKTHALGAIPTFEKPRYAPLLTKETQYGGVSVTKIVTLLGKKRFSIYQYSKAAEKERKMLPKEGNKTHIVVVSIFQELTTRYKEHICLYCCQ